MSYRLVIFTHELYPYQASVKSVVLRAKFSDIGVGSYASITVLKSMPEVKTGERNGQR